MLYDNSNYSYPPHSSCSWNSRSFFWKESLRKFFFSTFQITQVHNLYSCIPYSQSETWSWVPSPSSPNNPTISGLSFDIYRLKGNNYREELGVEDGNLVYVRRIRGNEVPTLSLRWIVLLFPNSGRLYYLARYLNSVPFTDGEVGYYRVLEDALRKHLGRQPKEELVMAW